MARAAATLPNATTPVKRATAWMWVVKKVPATVPNKMATNVATFNSALADGN